MYVNNILICKAIKNYEGMLRLFQVKNTNVIENKDYKDLINVHENGRNEY